jgi:hypothetical protein
MRAVDYPTIFAGRHSRPTPPNALSTTGKNNRTMARVVIEPTRPFDQNTVMSPPEPIIYSRNASSARLPSTSANVNGASGMLIFLKTYPTTPNPSISQISNIAFWIA